MNRVDLGERMQHWHSSSGDPVYAVGSFYFAGQRYPKQEIAEDALEGLKRDLEKQYRMLRGEKVFAPTLHGSTNDLRKFAGYTDRELRENIRDLRGIVRDLAAFIVTDYQRAP